MTKRTSSHNYSFVPYHEKVGKVVDLHCLFVSVDTPLGVREGGLVDPGIANESIDGLAELPFLEVVTKVVDGLKGIEFAIHRRETARVKVVQFGHSLHLVQVANGAHDVVLARPQESQSSLAAQS